MSKDSAPGDDRKIATPREGGLDITSRQKIISHLNGAAADIDKLLGKQSGPVTDSMKQTLERILKNIVDAREMAERK